VIHFADRVYAHVRVCLSMYMTYTLSDISVRFLIWQDASRPASPERFALASRDTAALFSLRTLCAAHGVRCNLQSPRNELDNGSNFVSMVTRRTALCKREKRTLAAERHRKGRRARINRIKRDKRCPFLFVRLPPS